MKLKIEVEIEVPDNIGIKFMKDVFDNSLQKELPERILNRIHELSQKREIVISEMNAKTPRFGPYLRSTSINEQKTAFIRIIG
jgi:hypothetical protein